MKPRSIEPGSPQTSLNRCWAICFVLISLYLLLWWLHLRPGIFSEDSGYYMQQVLLDTYTNRKPFLYARFLQITSLGGRSFELSGVVQGVLISAAISRIFAIAFFSRAHWFAIVVGLILVLNPYAANMFFYIQNDILFSVAIIYILVESLLIARQSQATRSGIALIALFAPMAFLFRENGLFFLPIWILAGYFLLKRDIWIKLAIAAAATSCLAYSTVAGVDLDDRQDPLYSAVIHEVVGLARPGYRAGIGSKLSPSTRRVIGQGRMVRAVAVYWPLYWDTIAFMPGGPRLVELSARQRSEIVTSFIRNDLIRNLPAVTAHRFEMFSGALLARAELVDPYKAPTNLPRGLADHKISQSLEVAGGVIQKINQMSIESRGLTWNALPGILVLALITLASLWRRDLNMLLLGSLLWIQAALIFIAAPSAEYRYVFMFYFAPLMLLVGNLRPTLRPASSMERAQTTVASEVLTGHGS